MHPEFVGGGTDPPVKDGGFLSLISFLNCACANGNLLSCGRPQPVFWVSENQSSIAFPQPRTGSIPMIFIFGMYWKRQPGFPASKLPSQ